MLRASENDTASPLAEAADPFPFEDFAPTLAQCFFIVLAGYASSRMGLLDAAESRGLRRFAQRLAAPCLVCVSLADAPLRELRWTLLAGLLLGKVTLFVLVAAGARILTGDAAAAGLLATFCVHCNDLPVGNPLISALYRDVRPEMTKYLFFMPALTTLFVVPMGDALVSPRDGLLRRGVARLSRSPMLLSTAAGVALNLLFGAQVPAVLHQPINVIAATIPGLALSILGLGMVGKERHLLGSAVVYAAVLVFVKMLLTPLVLHSCVRLLSGGGPASRPLSDFALLYGIVSPATDVFRTGRRIRRAHAAMSAAFIVSSFACFPLSFVVARFTVTREFALHLPALRRCLLPAAAAGLACDVAVCISLWWQKQIQRVPGCYVACLCLTQALTCSGVIVWCWGGPPSEGWPVFLQMALSFGGEVAGCFWAGTMAAVFVFRPSLAQGVLIGLAAFGVSVLVTCVMCVLARDLPQVFLFGRPESGFEFLQLITTTVLLGMGLLTVGAGLWFHCKRKGSPADNNLQDKDELNCENTSNCIYYIAPGNETNFCDQGDGRLFSEADEIDIYYHDVLKTERRDSSHVFGRKWDFRFFSLLLLTWIVLATRFISNLFKLAQSSSLEVMVPLEFLQSVLFVGQGWIAFLTFGIDIRTKVIRLIKWGRRSPQQPEESPQQSVAALCDRFRATHRRRCCAAIARERMWRGAFYRDSFWGHQLVDWLIETGLCADEEEAVTFGRKLLLGGVVRHLRGAMDFHDAPYMYHFVRV